MKNRISAPLFFLLVGAALCSCSRSTTVPTRAENLYTLAFPVMDSLFGEASIDNQFYSIRPAEFYEPAFQIRDSFTAVERCMVGLEDKNLFKGRPEIILDFEHLAEKEFCFPLPGARLLSDYGRRNGRRHTGVDLKISRRDTVLASFDGVVRMVGWARGYGNVIVIRHYNGLETVYAHNSRHLVRSGDRITAGTPISITGATGCATTEHLHYEIRINGKPINPNLLIDLTTQRIRNQRIVFTPGRQGNIHIETV